MSRGLESWGQPLDWRMSGVVPPPRNMLSCAAPPVRYGGSQRLVATAGRDMRGWVAMVGCECDFDPPCQATFASLFRSQETAILWKIAFSLLTFPPWIVPPPFRTKRWAQSGSSVHIKRVSYLKSKHKIFVFLFRHFSDSDRVAVLEKPPGGCPIPLCFFSKSGIPTRMPLSPSGSEPESLRCGGR